MPPMPPRRKFSDPVPRKGPKDVDSASRIRALRALVWGLPAGAVMGGLLGTKLGHPFLGALLGVVFVCGGAILLTELAGGAIGALHAPSGSSTPHKKEYSFAESLVVRGAVEEAIRAYEEAVAQDPREAEPYLRIARLMRDVLKRDEEAVRWFRRARRDARLSAGQDIRTTREVAEIYLQHLGDPRRAAPELARLAETYPETPDGRWAARELAEVKEGWARERGE